jgi:hypothetical protein
MPLNFLKKIKVVLWLPHKKKIQNSIERKFELLTNHRCSQGKKEKGGTSRTPSKET